MKKPAVPQPPVRAHVLDLIGQLEIAGGFGGDAIDHDTARDAADLCEVLLRRFREIEAGR